MHSGIYVASIVLAGVVAFVAGILKRTDGKSLPEAILCGGGAFVGAVTVVFLLVNEGPLP